ncbi:hypothetical protein DFQ28_000687 [Apophysomyces sp. BC1034]|nr:hypothetical protein DFQ29_008834 [Apophysomyces sp. BC1021]KAG0171610.1 hypothetical protein DFQ30_000708 [Apophysomyces sp. BC1015]KAG0191246.1 hypothetical protein DFQ28_000687 [Apophysomyces sp. BC1034]
MTRLTYEQHRYIQVVSHHKLIQYHQARVDLSIRKYVLIANMLRQQQTLAQREERMATLVAEQVVEDDKEVNGENDVPEAERWLDFVLNDLSDEEEEEEEEEDMFEEMEYTYNDGYELQRTHSRLPIESVKTQETTLSTGDESRITRQLYPIEEETRPEDFMIF